MKDEEGDEKKGVAAVLAQLLKDKANFKAFFDSIQFIDPKDCFCGIGFEFPKKTDFAKAVEEYNEAENSKNELAWLPEIDKELPAVYVLPKQLDCPEKDDASKDWLKGKKGKEAIDRLEKLKRGLKREVEYGCKIRDRFEKAIDALTYDDWQVVFGFQTDTGLRMKLDTDEPQTLLVKEDQSLLLGVNADFVLRLCNGFPLSKEQRNNFSRFITWANSSHLIYGSNVSDGEAIPVITAALRFFLSYPDMMAPEMEFQGYHLCYIKEGWKESWNFTFGQLMEKYKKEIDWDNPYFERKIKNKDTNEFIEAGDYQDITKQWVNKNDTFRGVKDRKKLEKRFKLFLQSLKGFTDWNTEGGTIKDWEDYQLKRWEAYKDLTKKDGDLPKSLTTREQIREAEKKEQIRDAEKK